MSRASILREISAERDRQDAKWGTTSQDKVRNGTGPTELNYQGHRFDKLAELHKEICGDGSSFAAILLEEVYEALAESDPFALRRELKEVAAVCVKWMEKIDRVEFAIPDAGGELLEPPTMLKHFGPLVAAAKDQRCNNRRSGERCVLAKGHASDHRAPGAIWVNDPEVLR